VVVVVVVGIGTYTTQDCGFEKFKGIGCIDVLVGIVKGTTLGCINEKDG